MLLAAVHESGCGPTAAPTPVGGRGGFRGHTFRAGAELAWLQVTLSRAAFAVTHNTPIIADVVVCFPLQNGFQYYSLGA